MNIIYLLMPIALLLGLGFLWAFVRMVRQGQYDDLETPAHRMLLDDLVVGTGIDDLVVGTGIDDLVVGTGIDDLVVGTRINDPVADRELRHNGKRK